jgi:hypothetical protein
MPDAAMPDAVVTGATRPAAAVPAPRARGSAGGAATVGGPDDRAVPDPYALADGDGNDGDGNDGDGNAPRQVFTVSGGDWDEIAEDATTLGDERIVVNMGPQHPSTHGVLRLILEIDGETVTEARCGIGYLHTGIEKSMEYRTWTQGVTFVTRMDYLTPLFQEAACCLAVERLLRITDDVPERASIIRVR